MIPVFSLQRQNKKLSVQLQRQFLGVINKGIFILGEKVSEFEEEFSRYIGVEYAISVASGTDALSLALLASGVGVGDEVIIPANSYPTVFGITAIGAVPKLVDIDPETFNIDPDKIGKAITRKSKAVIPVHLYGQPANLEKILPITKKHNIKLIEDCAQAHGAEIRISPPGRSPKATFQEETFQEGDWRKVGSVGDAGCFSFYPTKNLGCFGDGGMVVTRSREIFEKVKLFRMYGEKTRYESVLMGRNSRLDELQAAILLVKLNYLDQWNKRRREIAKKYEFGIKNNELGIKLPKEEEYARHVYHLFVVRSPSTSLRVNKRDELKKYLEEKGIGTAIHFPKPIHLQQSFRHLGYKKGDFPESEKASMEVLSIPIYPELRIREIEYIAETVNKFRF